MAYDRALLSEVLRRMEHERDRRRQEVEERQYNLSLSLPRLKEINHELRITSAKAMRIAFKSNNTDVNIEKLRRKSLALQEEKRSILVQNGYPANYLTVEENCPMCHDTGYVGTKLCRCVKRKAAELQKKQLSSLLPIDTEMFETFRLDYYSEQPDSRLNISPRELAARNFRRCSHFAETFGSNYENLLLYGSAGLGKTFLSSCIARRVTERGFSVAYDTAISIFEQYNYMKFRGGDSFAAAQAVERFRNADLLIVDDLGTETPSTFYTSYLYDVINKRLMRRLPIILSTNLLPADLETRYSSAIASRILGEFSQLRFIGTDIRKIRKKQRL